jgi:hypothetical protein
MRQYIHRNGPRLWRGTIAQIFCLRRSWRDDLPGRPDDGGGDDDGGSGGDDDDDDDDNAAGEAAGASVVEAVGGADGAGFCPDGGGGDGSISIDIAHSPATARSPSTPADV